MSDSKWIKVLGAMERSTSGVQRCEFKVIDSDLIGSSTRMLRANPCRGWLADTAAMSCGPFETKWIEWIRFPRRWRTTPGVGHFVEQDVETLAAEIRAAAHAKLELDEEFLWLYGYTGLLPESAWPGRGGATGSR